MSSSYHYIHVEKNEKNAAILEGVQQFAERRTHQVFLVHSPLGENKYEYRYDDCCVILSPGYRLMFINYGGDDSEFSEYIEDFIEDLGSISDKFQYKNVIGRPRQWRNELISSYDASNAGVDVEQLFAENKIDDPQKKKFGELLISLLTGSINDIDRVKEGVPDNILDAVKRKITLFDGDQTRFIYDRVDSKSVTIQGLSGTGKTELLLHKLKEIYTSDKSSRTIFTCHNKILASDIRNRIPAFFNFMKVEEQIEWERRLWCVNAWGSRSDPDSGAYRYICRFYEIAFHPFSYSMSFDKACSEANATITKEMIEERGYPFDYMLIDESQDFPDSFFSLCEQVTAKQVFIAGDIFQNIFDQRTMSDIEPDYLLSKCYRTDPKTLMFAHGIGMGLFEIPKLNWLEDDEWATCGYKISKEEQNGKNVYHLSRKPLRRFEDVADANIQSVEIVKTSAQQPNDIISVVLNILASIRDEHPTVCPEDIGIIFIDGSKRIYAIADMLEEIIPAKLGWHVNKAYESKEKSENSVFVSNRNNVKGLEFPFVICISEVLVKAPSYRNALYTMISRSFIKTYLLVNGEKNNQLLPSLEEHLGRIVKNGVMDVWEPDKEEKESILTSIKQIEQKLSLYDVAHDIFAELDIPPIFHSPLIDVVRKVCGEDFDREKVKEVVEFNYCQMSGSNN